VPLPTCSPSPVARACRSSAVPVVWISADPSRCVGSQSPVRRGRQRAAFPATAGQPHTRRLPHLPAGAFFGRCWAATDPGVPYWLMVSRDGLSSTPGVMAPSGPGVRPGAATSFIPQVYLMFLVLWKNGSGFGACTSIDPKLLRRIRGWPSGPQKKKRSTKRSKSHPLIPTSAFVSIRGIRSARFSTAPDL